MLIKRPEFRPFANGNLTTELTTYKRIMKIPVLNYASYLALNLWNDIIIKQ